MSTIDFESTLNINNLDTMWYGNKPKGYLQHSFCRFDVFLLNSHGRVLGKTIKQISESSKISFPRAQS